MNKTIKIIATATAALMMIAGVSACGSDTGGDSDKGRVYYLNLKPEASDKWKALAEEYQKETFAQLPARLHETARKCFATWYQHMIPIQPVWDMIHRLKEQQTGLYILSNAPIFFEEHADFFEITRLFDGAVYSGSIKKFKPNPDIYQHLFDTFSLNPSDCFFMDDKPENIKAAQKLGMNGMVFTGENLSEIKHAIGLEE